MTINFKIGDIFLSDADYLVNTVNCEGHMGKGIAYQFKKRFPNMEKDYKKKCELGELVPGKLLFFEEGNKIIINFPTKNKWRAKSKIEYIEQGLKTLKKEIIDRKITSIAIPPLGSGNGGLNWNDVKELIILYLSDLSESVEIEVFEPTTTIQKNKNEPKSNVKSLYILYISERVSNPKLVKLKNSLRLVEIFSRRNIIINDFLKESEMIKELKTYYGTEDNGKLYSILRTKLVSDSIESLEKNFKPLADKAIELVSKYDESTIFSVIEAFDLIESKKTNKIPSDILSLMFTEKLINEDLFGNIKINYNDF